MRGLPADRPVCPICATRLTHFAPGRVLQTYDVDYFRCGHCGVITLPEPFWLEEAYEDAIFDGDTGLLRRCRVLATLTSVVISSERTRAGRFLDWAGGYGVLTRLMRDKGLAFHHFEPYAQNLFAQGLEADPATERFDLATAFEVVEHLKDPVKELAVLARSTDRLLFTTQLQPPTPPRPDEWWYFMADSGQHIMFHTRRSLELLGEQLGYELTSNGDQYHLFHRGPLRPLTRLVLSPALARAKRMVRREAAATGPPQPGERPGSGGSWAEPDKR